LHFRLMARESSPDSDATASSSMLSSPSLYNQQVFQDVRQPLDIAPAASFRSSEFSSYFLADNSLKRPHKRYSKTKTKEMFSCTCHSSVIQGQSNSSHGPHTDFHYSRVQDHYQRRKWKQHAVGKMFRAPASEIVSKGSPQRERLRSSTAFDALANK
jgi:hypothetical protein